MNATLYLGVFCVYISVYSVFDTLILYPECISVYNRCPHECFISLIVSLSFILHIIRVHNNIKCILLYIIYCIYECI